MLNPDGTPYPSDEISMTSRLRILGKQYVLETSRQDNSFTLDVPALPVGEGYWDCLLSDGVTDRPFLSGRVVVETCLSPAVSGESEQDGEIEVKLDSSQVVHITINMAGAPGKDGATFTPAISPEGILSWTNNGGLENPAPFDFGQFVDGKLKDAVMKDADGMISVNGVNFNDKFGIYVSEGNNLVVAPEGKPDSLLIDPDGRVYASGSGNGMIVYNYAMFYGVTSFGQMAYFNNGITNTTGVYYTPSGTSVQIGAATPVADGAIHTWLSYDNGTAYNGAVVSAQTIRETGVPHGIHLYLGSGGGNVVINGNTLDMRNKRITNLANGTSPTDAANVSQLPQ